MIKIDNLTLKDASSIDGFIKEMSLIDKEKIIQEEWSESLKYSTWNNIFILNYKDSSSEKENKEIGYIRIYKSLLNKRAIIETSYILPEYRQKGFMGKAHIALGFYIFDHLKYNKIESSCFGFNEASYTAQKKYFTLEGERKNHIYHKGELYSKYLFGFTKEEFYERYFEKFKNIVEIK